MPEKDQPLTTADPLLTALFAQVRSDLQSYLPPGLLTSGGIVNGSWGFKVYQAMDVGESELPLSERERKAILVQRLVGLLKVNEDICRNSQGGLNIPCLPSSYSGGDKLLDSVLGEDRREGISLLLRGAISAYIECLDRHAAKQFEPLSLSLNPNIRVKPLLRTRYNYSRVLHQAVETHIMRTGACPCPQDILDYWEHDRPACIIQTLEDGVEYWNENAKRKTFSRQAISRFIHHYVEKIP